MLKNVVKGAMEERGMSLRDVGRALGISHTTISRVLNEEPVDLNTLIKIAEWLNIRPSALLDTLPEDGDVEAKINTLVQLYPELQNVLEMAAEAIEHGQADPGLIKDIISYAEYRLQTAKNSSGG